MVHLGNQVVMLVCWQDEGKNLEFYQTPTYRASGFSDSRLLDFELSKVLALPTLRFSSLSLSSPALIIRYR